MGYEDNVEQSLNYVYFIAGVEECIYGIAKKYHLETIKKSEYENMLKDNQLDLVYPVGGEDERPKSLFETKVKNECTVEEFQHKYPCRLLKINRNGKTVGDEVLKKDDVILMESLYDIQHYADDFGWIKETVLKEWNGDSLKCKIFRMIVLVLFVIAMIVVVSVNLITLFTAASVVAVVSICCGILSWKQSLLSIHAKIILVIACSFSLAKAIEIVGLGDLLSEGFLYIFGNVHPFGVLCGIYLIANLLSAVVSNAATAVLLFPMVYNITVQSQILTMKSTMYTLMIASSVSLITPIGYQTNLMVQKAGGYKTVHYLKFGSILTVVCLFVTTGILYGYN